MDATKKRKQAPQADAKEQPTQDAKKRPLKTIRVEDVNATIWPREVMIKGELTVFYSVTFERSYRDAAGQWRYTRYFDVNDLGKVVAAAQQASEAIGEMLNNPEIAIGIGRSQKQ